MRILCIEPGPYFSVADVHRGWHRALTKLGCDVVNVNYDERLTVYDKVARMAPDYDSLDDEAQMLRVCQPAAHSVRADIFDVWPDLVLVFSGFYIPPDFYARVRAKGIKVALLCTESPYEDDRQVKKASQVDYVIINDPTNLEKFKAVNKNTMFLPHAYDPEIHKPGPPDPDCASDFAFVGTGYPSRIEFFEQVDWSGLEVMLGGNWQWVKDGSPLLPFLIHDRGLCVDNTDAVRMYRSTKVSANLYRKEATQPGLEDGWAMGPREVELAASGAFFMREPRGEGDELFPFLPTFTEPGEFTEKLRDYLAHDKWRMVLSDMARRRVADRTFINHAKQFLNSLDT